ncbi:TIM barrel protein [Litoribacter ruber]|uniref:hydroxypyruvate isomerase family protein n=1 Tax=Litoribacter ruber TaxID=702568 RepID=UPI001BD97FF7|nr:TIM barrel protein [Litoribacter ruber]MBT0812767.1 TIM barrel protein [Litoribacter ruber]
MDSRRTMLKKLAGTALMGALPLGGKVFGQEGSASLRGNINHSVCRWVMNDLPIADFCDLVKSLGFNAIDLVGPADWPVLQEKGVDSSMCNGAEINLVQGFNNTDYHSQLWKNYQEMIPLVSKAGFKNLICFSGNRDGIADEEGLENSVKGLEKLLPLAEKHGVVLQMELLNSKVDHPGYMADNSPWGVELAKRLDSDNFKLLYDIYHMQINEGDVIRTIQDNHQYFGHYHTAGNPGRNEINETQELNYRAIMKAIVETGFEGYVAQEFIITRENRRESLKEAVEICDV